MMSNLLNKSRGPAVTVLVCADAGTCAGRRGEPRVSYQPLLRGGIISYFFQSSDNKAIKTIYPVILFSFLKLKIITCRYYNQPRVGKQHLTNTGTSPPSPGAVRTFPPLGRVIIIHRNKDPGVMSIGM